MSSCKKLYEVLCEYLEGSLPSAVTVQIEEHLIICKNCLVYVKTYRKTIELLHEASIIEMPEELKAAVLKSLG